MAIAKLLFAIVREFQQFDAGVVERSQRFALGLEFQVVLGNLGPSITRIITPITL